jgi:hypothetical protein
MVVAFIDCPIFDGGNCAISEPGNWGGREKGSCDAFEEVFSGRIAVGVCIKRLQRLSRIYWGWMNLVLFLL